MANAIGAPLREPINSGLTRWRLTVKMDALVAGSGREERSPRVSTRLSLCVENDRTDAVRAGQTCLASQKLRCLLK